MKIWLKYFGKSFVKINAPQSVCLSSQLRSVASEIRGLLCVVGFYFLAGTATRAQTNYVTIYDGALQGAWVRQCWEGYPLATDFAASAPGFPGAKAIEVNFTNAWDAFGLADMLPGWDLQWNYLNEVKTVEFDIYFASNSTSPDNLTFILDDVTYADEPALSTMISNWSFLPDAQRYSQWLHATVDLQSLHPTIARFYRFLLFNNGDFRPHCYLNNVRLGWVSRTNAPVITLDSAALNPTYNQLTVAFHTDEYTVSRVDYGVGNYGTASIGDPSDWSLHAAFALTNLTPGTTLQYRITASDHRMDSNAPPNVGYYYGTLAVPLIPAEPPLISGFVATNLLGNRATLIWADDRPCTAQLTYHKANGDNLVRLFPDLATNHVCVLDLLEPLTAYNVSLVVTDAFNLVTTQALSFTSGTSSVPDVVITVDPNSAHAISPWIYGINFYNSLPNPPRNLPFDRHGGNRWTAYNWENNASNAGNDWYFSSDDYLGGGDIPAEALRARIASDHTNGLASLITVPMLGYVAADKNGNVDINDPNHLANRFKPIRYQKGAAFTTTPNTNGTAVYIDESLWALRSKFTNDIFADPNRPTFVSLDNEPELWPSTHQEIQGTAEPDVTNFLHQTIALCQAIKGVDAAAQTFGPVHYGFYGISYWQGAPGFSADYWFTDKYLQTLRDASVAAGRRLLDVYDFHWYSEATDSKGNRIGGLLASNLNSDQIQAIVQSPRSLWDTNYTEKSWIAQYFNGPVYIAKRLQDKINTNWPGTGLAITEYDNGGENHIAGAIAQADNLGIYGRLGLFAACYWPNANTFPFVAAGFKMFRDYDGNLSAFGDLSLAANSSATTNVAVYVSADSQHPNRQVIVAINRSFDVHDVGFQGTTFAGVAKIYRIQNQQTDPIYVGSVPADLSSWVVTLPPLSVSTIEVKQAGTYADWVVSHFAPADQSNPAVSGMNADPDHLGIPNITRYAFQLPARGPAAATLIPLLINAGGQNTPALRFNRLASAADMVYHLESSSDLLHWSDQRTFAAGQPTQITVADIIPLAANAPRFLRLRIEYIP